MDPATKEAKVKMLELLQSEVNMYRKGGRMEGAFPERWLPAAVCVLPEPWTEQNHFLNSSMKVVRGRVEEAYKANMEYAYTPEYAEKPPSIGKTTPVIKPAASLFTKNKSPPSNSSLSPKRPIGVAAKILPVLAVGVPSSLNKSFAFCFVEKKPGAIALTRIPTFEK